MTKTTTKKQQNENQSLKNSPLLTGSIPNLHFYLLPSDVHSFEAEINAEDI
jgi:hypothetical protein